MRHLTEADLRRKSGLEPGAEIRLAPDERLTPAARDFLQARRIKVLAPHAPVASSSFAAPADTPGPPHPLRLGGADSGGRTVKPLFDALNPKPERLTHLSAGVAVGKEHPRILLRGKLDSLIADFVLAQTEIGREGELPERLAAVLHRCLADLRSWAGWILRAEVTGEAMPPLKMARFSYEEIRQISHRPLRYLHHDHVVPEAAQGPDAARLNRLRARTREVELCAVRTFTDEDDNLARDDVILALNRLSSAVYVLMVLVVAQRGGVTAALDVFA